MSGRSALDASELGTSSAATIPQTASDITSYLNHNMDLLDATDSTTVIVGSLNEVNIDNAINKATSSRLVNSDVDEAKESSLRCTCGCVPNVMSLFEMAVLRAEYRNKLKTSEQK